MIADHYPRNEVLGDFVLITADRDMRNVRDLAALEQSAASVARTRGRRVGPVHHASDRQAHRRGVHRTSDGRGRRPAGGMRSRTSRRARRTPQRLADGAGGVSSGAGQVASGADQAVDGTGQLLGGIARPPERSRASCRREPGTPRRAREELRRGASAARRRAGDGPQPDEDRGRRPRARLLARCRRAPPAGWIPPASRPATASGRSTRASATSSCPASVTPPPPPARSRPAPSRSTPAWPASTGD